MPIDWKLRFGGKGWAAFACRQSLVTPIDWKRFFGVLETDFPRSRQSLVTPIDWKLREFVQCVGFVIELEVANPWWRLLIGNRAVCQRVERGASSRQSLVTPIDWKP